MNNPEPFPFKFTLEGEAVSLSDVTEETLFAPFLVIRLRAVARFSIEAGFRHLLVILREGRPVDFPSARFLVENYLTITNPPQVIAFEFAEVFMLLNPANPQEVDGIRAFLQIAWMEERIKGIPSDPMEARIRNKAIRSLILDSQRIKRPIYELCSVLSLEEFIIPEIIWEPPWDEEMLTRIAEVKREWTELFRIQLGDRLEEARKAYKKL